MVTRVRQSRGLKALIIMAGILALAAVAVPAQASAATSAASVRSSPSKASCPDVDFIGARGSGQAYDPRGPFRGFGPEVNKMIAVMQNTIHKAHITSTITAVNYPAVSTRVLKPSSRVIKLISHPKTVARGLVLYYREHVKVFLDSIAKGVSAMVADAVREGNKCRGAVFVFGGYSQGAMVAHQAELELEKKHVQEFNNTIGTILLADGDRVSNTKAKEFGTSKHSGKGIATALHHGVADVPIPGTTANICDKKDLVCNFGVSQLLRFRSSIAVHTSYASCDARHKCTFKPVLTHAANSVGSDILFYFGVQPTFRA
jgi:hypothetical protein